MTSTAVAHVSPVPETTPPAEPPALPPDEPPPSPPATPPANEPPPPATAPPPTANPPAKEPPPVPPPTANPPANEPPPPAKPPPTAKPPAKEPPPAAPPANEPPAAPPAELPMHVPPRQASPERHSTHREADAPHAVVAFPGRHTPRESQHPFGHVPRLHSEVVPPAVPPPVPLRQRPPCELPSLPFGNAEHSESVQLRQTSPRAPHSVSNTPS